MISPQAGIAALSEAETVTITGRRGTEETAAAAVKLQVRRRRAYRTPPSPSPSTAVATVGWAGRPCTSRVAPTEMHGRGLRDVACGGVLGDVACGGLLGDVACGGLLGDVACGVLTCCQPSSHAGDLSWPQVPRRRLPTDQGASQARGLLRTLRGAAQVGGLAWGLTRIGLLPPNSLCALHRAVRPWPGHGPSRMASRQAAWPLGLQRSSTRSHRLLGRVALPLGFGLAPVRSGSGHAARVRRPMLGRCRCTTRQWLCSSLHAHPRATRHRQRGGEGGRGVGVRSGTDTAFDVHVAWTSTWSLPSGRWMIETLDGEQRRERQLHHRGRQRVEVLWLWVSYVLVDLAPRSQSSPQASGLGHCRQALTPSARR